MRQESIGSYVWFGTCVRYLQDATEGLLIHEPAAGGGHILSNLESFFDGLNELNLQVTIRASGELAEVRQDLAATDQAAKLTADQAARLRTAITDLRKTLEAELAGSTAYVVSPKRLDITLLIKRIDQLLAPGVFAKLPVIARYDLAEAGKCLAFERPTAASFHVLRGTESVLRAFYCSLVKQKRAPLNWGSIVVDLRKRRSARGHEVLLNHLDNIRAAFRNPTAHPEKFYDIQEAQDLWSLCVDAINRMATVL